MILCHFHVHTRLFLIIKLKQYLARIIFMDALDYVRQKLDFYLLLALQIKSSLIHDENHVECQNYLPIYLVLTEVINFNYGLVIDNLVIFDGHERL